MLNTCWQIFVPIVEETSPTLIQWLVHWAFWGVIGLSEMTVITALGHSIKVTLGNVAAFGIVSWLVVKLANKYYLQERV